VSYDQVMPIFIVGVSGVALAANLYLAVRERGRWQRSVLYWLSALTSLYVGGVYFGGVCQWLVPVKEMVRPATVMLVALLAANAISEIGRKV